MMFFLFARVNYDSPGNEEFDAGQAGGIRRRNSPQKF
jgi:hypothetical protein